MIRVFNLATQEEKFYFCNPFQAVVAAYAQSFRDFNTWAYSKYWMQVDYTKHTYLCGDWCVIHTLEAPANPA